MSHLTRRHFVQLSAAAGLAAALPGCATASRRPRRISPNEKVKIEIP